jgi:hypothetical protein
MTDAPHDEAAVTFAGLRLVVRRNEIVQGSPSSAVRRPQTDE